METEESWTLTRRHFLRGATAAVAGATIGGALSACGGVGATKGSDARLRVGAPGLATATSLDPRLAAPGVSSIAVYHLYDLLIRLEGDHYELQLAEAIEPNRDATLWTVRLRPGVQFHDGRPVRAADVVYSLRAMAEPKLSPAFSLIFADMDTAALRAVDKRTVAIPLRRPRGDFRDAALSVGSIVIPEGTRDFGKPIGSGPYKLAASEPGNSMRLVANRDYWGGAPSVEVLELVTISDPAARLNGLRSGQLDYVVGISPTGARAGASRGIELLRGGPVNSNALLFAMNERKAPFDDPRVRGAMRLAVDRQQLIDHVLFSAGTVGNDLVGKGLPGYAADLPQRERDVEQARSLFRAAGVRKLTLRAADLLPGLVDASRLLAQQLGEVGVQLRVEEAQRDTYFVDRKAVLNTPFQAFYLVNRPAAVTLSAIIGPRAPWNLMGYGQGYAHGLQAAQATVDDRLRSQRFIDLQHELYEHGSDVVWGFQEQLDAAREGVRGIRRSQLVPLFAGATVS